MSLLILAGTLLLTLSKITLLGDLSVGRCAAAAAVATAYKGGIGVGATVGWPAALGWIWRREVCPSTPWPSPSPG